MLVRFTLPILLSIAMMTLPISAFGESGVADGKGLICLKQNQIRTDSYAQRLGRKQGWWPYDSFHYFDRGEVVSHHFEEINDRVERKQSEPEQYRSDPEFIEWDSFSGNSPYYRLNRKTLRLFVGEKVDGEIGGYKNCEVLDSKAYEKRLDQYLIDKQSELNEKLKVNKI